MKLTIASYNILHGAYSEYDMKKLVESIVACGADIVGVQEVDVNAKRSGYRDIAQMMAEELGFEARFVHACDLQGGEYGTAILSRYPIASLEVIPLKSGKYEQRSIGGVQIDVEGEKINFWNTHLSYENLEQRSLQVEQIKERLASEASWILTGDFNTANFEELRVLGEVSLVNDYNHVYKTFRDSGSPIDNIIYTSPWKVTDAGIVDNDHSDHNLLYAVLEK